MTLPKPRILITNDDGFRSKGIAALTDALRDLGELTVFAPETGQSGMAAAITSTIPVRFSLIKQEDDLSVYACSGTPVDCVKLALHTVCKQPDLLVAGINHGGNMAIAVNYSGTLGAAAEGCINDIPSLGISMLNHDPDADCSESAGLARLIARDILINGLPQGTYLNLNVPDIPRVKGIKVCRQARGRWEQEFLLAHTPDGEPVYWLTGDYRDALPILPDNDTLALANGFASLVPCKIDVTDYSSFPAIKEHFEL
jgi:5'-nucleotidase